VSNLPNPKEPHPPTWQKAKDPRANMRPSAYGLWSGYFSQTPDEKAQHEARARESWKVLQSTASDSASSRYIKHEEALQEFENEKLNKLQIMRWAQQTRTRFLRLSMADRRVFLDVLTADEHGAFSKMFELQTEVAAEGTTDDDLKLTRRAIKLLEPGKSEKHIDDVLPEIRRVSRKQKTKKQQRAALTAGTKQALPAGSLNLPGNAQPKLGDGR